MKTFKQFIQEVRYINPKGYSETPIKDSETIRVFHGFNKIDDAIYTIKYGLSGQEEARRIYSYESGNNPKGLFVTIDFNTATKFAHSKIIIEFSTKISDLEAPVWVGGRNYFVQGEYTKSFKDMSEREQQQLINRQTASQSPYPQIANSDRPELAQSIFDNPERQALYIGNLNPNMIKRVWLKTPGADSWKHITPNQFLKQYKNNQPSDYTNYQEKLFKPNDDFSIDTLYKNLLKLENNKTTEEIHRDILYFISELFTPHYQSEYELSKLGFFPKQIKQILDLYKSGDWKTKIKSIMKPVV